MDRVVRGAIEADRLEAREPAGIRLGGGGDAVLSETVAIGANAPSTSPSVRPICRSLGDVRRPRHSMYRKLFLLIAISSCREQSTSKAPRDASQSRAAPSGARPRLGHVRRRELHLAVSAERHHRARRVAFGTATRRRFISLALVTRSSSATFLTSAPLAIELRNDICIRLFSIHSRGNRDGPDRRRPDDR